MLNSTHSITRRPIKVLCMAVVLFAPQLVIADSALGKEARITVSISPTVQEQIKKASPDERKKMEAAISTGNKFIPHHFDGSAYERNDHQEEKIWQKNIRPLVTPLANKGDDDWYFEVDVFADAAPKLEINRVQVVFEVVCPVPELISANAVGDHVELSYQTKIIGMWKTSSKEHLTQGDILPDEKEEFDEVLITVDKSNRVSRVASKYAVLPTIPKTGIDIFESYVKWPPRAIFQGPNGADQESESEAKAKIPQYKKFIELIKSEEAAACKGTSAKYKQQPLERE